MAGRTYKPCARCREPHHHFAYCKDGVKVVKNAPPFKKGDPLRGAAKKHAERKAETATSSENVTVVSSAAPTVTSARDDLRGLAEGLPEGSPQRKSIELLLARDEAREQHQKDEQALQERDPAARLPVPTILRDLSEEKGRELNREMDRLIFAAGTNRASQREIMPKEAQTVHDTIAGLEERRDRKASAARDAARPPQHRPGSQAWFCHVCGQRFNTGTMDEVRRWAREDPTWRLACP